MGALCMPYPHHILNKEGLKLNFETMVIVLYTSFAFKENKNKTFPVLWWIANTLFS